MLDDDFNIEDYSLGTVVQRPNKLIAATFKTLKNYFDGNKAEIPPADEISDPWEFLTRGYLELITSSGRNEPDDRVYSIEVNFGDPIDLDGALLAVVVTHTIWDGPRTAPWLSSLARQSVEIITYPFYPNRPPEYYQTHVEIEVRKFYELRGAI